MNKLFFTPIAAVLLATAVTLPAADSAEVILKKHVNAIGGEALHKKAKSREIVATMDMPAAGFTAEMKILAKAPDKIRTELEIPQMGKVVEGYDGKVAWSQSPFTGLIEKSGGQLEQTKRQADFHRDVEIAKRFETWKVRGNETVSGKETIVLEGSSPGKDGETMWLDAKTYLIHKVETTAETPQGRLKTSTITTDYRDVDGMKFPFAIKVESDLGAMNLKIKQIKFGVEAPDSLFAKPAN
ncbi:MAG TPA: hypothetical protein DCY13_11115 [Verrucomicrobiales bacterium]|nr:hypothetical protein [Verrucomicrobiales bacterium]